MGHIVRNPAWGVIDLNTDTGAVFVQERWRYNWITMPPSRPWTRTQRRRFHNTLDRQIWRVWSGRLRLRAAGNHAFVARINGRTPPVSFDVRWIVRRQAHWDVTVRKMPPGSDPTTFISNVDFPARQIHLDSADVDAYQASNAAGQRRRFYALPHEFGHTMPERPGLANQDEYGAGSPFLADTDSILNIGRQVRARHLRALLTELNAMLPGVVFSA